MRALRDSAKLHNELIVIILFSSLAEGDIDDSVFIVQSGMLNVLINNNDGSTLSLKHVKRGESVTSLLSFIDVLAVSTFVRSHCHCPY